MLDWSSKFCLSNCQWYVHASITFLITKMYKKWLTIRKVKFIYRILSQRINSCQLFSLSVEQLFLISVVDFQLLFQSDVDLFPIYWSYICTTFFFRFLIGSCWYIWWYEDFTPFNSWIFSFCCCWSISKLLILSLILLIQLKEDLFPAC